MNISPASRTSKVSKFKHTADRPISIKTVLDLHRLCRSGIGNAGKLKEKEGDIMEKYPDGRVRVRFKTVSPKQTKPFMKELI